MPGRALCSPRPLPLPRPSSARLKLPPGAGCGPAILRREIEVVFGSLRILFRHGAQSGQIAEPFFLEPGIDVDPFEPFADRG